MAAMSRRLQRRAEELARKVGRFRSMARTGGLRQRVEALEVEVQECRQLNLRLAELTDVVQELLLPVAQRDEQRVTEVMEKYARGL
jgi:flagellar biosynthesis/type III secretory pathway chaperone